MGWTGARVLMLWPAGEPQRRVAARTGPAVRLSAPGRAAPALPRKTMLFGRPRSSAAAVPAGASPPAMPRAAVAVPRPPAAAPTALAAGQDLDVPRDRTTISPASEKAPRAQRSRLSIDAWLLARPGGGDSLAFGQLGASQAGARLAYALDAGRHVALSARVSAPLRDGRAEAGIGIDLRPTALPIHLLVEQRIDGTGGRPAVTLYGGGSAALPARFRLDGYAQAGAVRARGGFVDAALLALRPVAERDRTRVELGVGAWGAAQRGVARLDAGPSAALVLPGAGGALRLQLDYRLRLAGGARPGSGPALTLGGSF